MNWDTVSNMYGSFHPQWKRSYLTHMPDRERERTRISMSERVPTTQNEYGQWYAMARNMPRDVFMSKDPYPQTRRTEPSYFPKPWTPVRSGPAALRTPLRTPMTVRTPMTPRLPPVQDAFMQEGMTSRAQTWQSQHHARLNLPDVKGIDVQLLTTDNAIVSVAPVASHVDRVSYPRSVTEISLPNIKEINVKFNMKGDKTVGVRAVPIPDNE